VLVGQGKDILCDGALVCLVEAGQSEGPGLEASRGRIRDGERLVGMQRAAVVLGLAVLVSSICQLVPLRLRAIASYLLGGSCLFLLRAMGSKSLATVSGFAAASANDVVSTSGAASVAALRRNSGCTAFTVGLASLHRAVAVR
jgi:hypothetical protein